MASSALNDRFHINYIIYLVACIPKIVISNMFMLHNHLHIFICIWANYNDLTTTSLGIMVSKGNHPQMALIQVSELL